MTTSEKHEAVALMEKFMTITATLIEYMPHYLRASHEAAGNRGIYPHNGAERDWVRGNVDPSDLDDWARIVLTSDDPIEDTDGTRRPSWIARVVLDDIPADALAPPDQRCPCGYPMPCVKRVPIGFCKHNF